MTARAAAAWLVARSLLWTVLLPGGMAGYLPWRFFGLHAVHPDLRHPLDLLGVLFVGAGVVLLGACILEFARSGRGTLAPLDPPRELVVQGLYRFVRNPMYLSVAMILIGECLLTRTLSLLEFTAAWFVAVNLFVLGYEEPTLRRRFGDSYEQYLRQVGRWIPSLPPRTPRRQGH
jgi:protein-S-isoprenylcysteine O-methyltransferase Ste14